ncbi:MAG: galactokinase [Mycobacteriales bacterium]
MTGSERTRAVIADFRQLTGRAPDGCWAAPGRINLIGDHTDYNEGFALPFAIDRTAVAAVGLRTDGVLRLASRQREGVVELPVAEAARSTGWAAYLAGTVWSLNESGAGVQGLDLVLDSDVPVGSSLSSSAAVESVTAIALADLLGLDSLTGDRVALARLCQRGENEIVGVPSGLLDQLSSLCSAEGHALFCDFRSLDLDRVPFDPAAAGLVVLCVDTRSERALGDSGYADRRTACERVAAALGVPALRDVTLDQLDSGTAAELDGTDRRRARHVVTEDARVLDSITLLGEGRMADLGPLLTASHVSLRDDFAVSWPAADTAVDAALAAGALGARMTGGGFGGCALALVPADRAGEVGDAIVAAAKQHGHPEPAVFPVVPSPGASRLE